MLDHALAYLKQGLPVFPVRPGPKKQPLIKWKVLQERLPTEAEVREWWGRWPDANIGMATGALSNRLVLDVDPRHGGVETWNVLQEEFGPLPQDTYRVRTGGGGLHYHFKMPPSRVPSTQASLGPGIDVRATGGYAMLPPSVHESGKVYREEGAEGTTPSFYPVPSWFFTVLERVKQQKRQREQPAPGLIAKDPMAWVTSGLKTATGHGKRRGTALELAGALLLQGKTATQVKEKMASWWDLCEQPPGDPFPLEELHTLVDDLAVRERGKREALGPSGHDHSDVGSLTERENALRFAEVAESDLRYIEGLGWAFWDDQRWATNAQNGKSGLERALNLVSQWVQRQETYACMKASDDRDRVRIKQWTSKLHSRKHMENVLHLGRSTPLLYRTVDQFDSDPWTLNVRNGLLDLRSETFRLRGRTRESNVTKRSPVPYEPTATCPRWDRFMLEIMAGNTEMVRYLQRVLGYSLTGDMREQVFFILYGTGANGKSVFLETVRAVLGDYVGEAHPGAVVKRRDVGPGNELAALRGLRLVSISEWEEGAWIDEPRVKALTGGDPLTVRHLYQQPFTFTPTFKLFVRSNHKLRVKGTDHGWWRRVQQIPFTVRFEGVTADKTLGTTLLSEGRGILRWLVEGCLMWQREGLRPPTMVVEATRAYREGQDVLGQFLGDRTRGDREASVPRATLYQVYRAWCKDTGERELSGRAFCEAMRERQYEDRRLHGVDHWMRLALSGHDSEATPF